MLRPGTVRCVAGARPKSAVRDMQAARPLHNVKKSGGHVCSSCGVVVGFGSSGRFYRGIFGRDCGSSIYFDRACTVDFGSSALRGRVTPRQE